MEALLKVLDVWLIVFGIVVAVGVTGESIVGFMHFRKGRELQRLQTAENLRQQHEIERLRNDSQKLEQESTRLAHESASIRLQTAAANEREANAEKQAEQEKLARVKIEERLADRRLGLDQQQRIAARIRTYSGQTANIFIYASGPEIAGIARDITAILKSAGWSLSIEVGQEMSRSVRGILVEARSSADPENLKAAADLSSLLRRPDRNGTSAS